MFIEFTIDAEATNQSFIASHLYKMLETNLAIWAETHEITYTKKLYKNTFRVAFNDDRYYTVFRLTWQDSPYIEHRLIDRHW